METRLHTMPFQIIVVNIAFLDKGASFDFLIKNIAETMKAIKNPIDHQ